MKGESEKDRERGEGRGGGREGVWRESGNLHCSQTADTWQAPPHEGYWQQLSILVEVLIRGEREGAKTERERQRGGWWWKAIEKGGRERGR